MQIKQPILAVLATLLLVFGASSAIAETKIAVVDVQRAILNSEEAQQKMQQIQEEFSGDEQEIKQLQADASAMAERLQKDGEVMSDSERQKLQRQIQSKNEDFQYLRNRLQKRIESR
ncbi:MAG: OmpH family outer membrane protein, partial [Pseudomonadales bacterium]